MATKVMQLRRNLAPHRYSFRCDTQQQMMQEYDSQTKTYSPSWANSYLYRAIPYITSVDGSTAGQPINVGSYTTKVILESTGKSIYESEYSKYIGVFVEKGQIAIRANRNIPTGTVYLVKVIATIYDPVISANVKVETEMFRIGCVDKTKDEIRFALTEGVQNIVYNSEAYPPYLYYDEDTPFLQYLKFKITKGGKTMTSGAYSVAATNGNGIEITPGVSLHYVCQNLGTLFLNNTVPEAYTDKQGNSVYPIDRFLAVESSKWSVNTKYGGILTYDSDPRKLYVYWGQHVTKIRISIKDATNNTEIQNSWITPEKIYQNVTYDVVGGVLICEVTITSKETIGRGGMYFLLQRNVAIIDIAILGLDALECNHMAGKKYQFNVIENYNEPRLSIRYSQRERSPLHSLKVEKGIVTVVVDCGASRDGNFLLKLFNENKTSLYDERPISFARANHDIEVVMPESVFIEAAKESKFKVKLFGEGHEVYNYSYYYITSVKSTPSMASISSSKDPKTGFTLALKTATTIEGTYTIIPHEDYELNNQQALE